MVAEGRALSLPMHRDFILATQGRIIEAVRSFNG